MRKGTPITKRAKNTPLNYSAIKQTSGGSSNSSSNQESSSRQYVDTDDQGYVWDVTENTSSRSSAGDAQTESFDGRRASTPDERKKWQEGYDFCLLNPTDPKCKGYVKYEKEITDAYNQAMSSQSEEKSETRNPRMVKGKPGEDISYDTRWNWQQRNINRTRNSNKRQNRKEARADLDYMVSQGLVEKTGKIGRGKGYQLTEKGKADANAMKRFDLNQADIFGAASDRFDTDAQGNITGRNQTYDAQSNSKNRAQTGSYDPNAEYREATEDHQYNVNIDGPVGGTTTQSTSSSSSNSSSSQSGGGQASSSEMWNGDGSTGGGDANMPSGGDANTGGSTDNLEYLPYPDNTGDMEVMYDDPNKSEAPTEAKPKGPVGGKAPAPQSLDIDAPSLGGPVAGAPGSEMGQANAASTPESAGIIDAKTADALDESLRRKSILGSEGPLQMRYKHDSAMMYRNSPIAKLTDLDGDGDVTRKDVLIGRGVLSKDGSPLNKYKNEKSAAQYAPFRMKGYGKK